MDTPSTGHRRGAAVIIGLSLIVSTCIGSYAFYRARALADTLQVTGSTRQKISSDQVKWVGQFTRNVSENDLKSGYAQMAKDTLAVKKFFADSGFTDAVDVSPVFLDQDYRNYQAGEPKYYILRQTVTVQADDVAKITALAKNIQPLTDAGVIYSTQSLEYTYSKLADLRVQLLGEAMKDARMRAANIAESGGRHVGDLRSASVGTVQVLAVGSNDVSDYGAYDTSTVDKEVMVTVHAAFSMR